MERILVTVTGGTTEDLGALARGICLARRIGAHLYVVGLERPTEHRGEEPYRLVPASEVGERMHMLIEGARGDGVSVSTYILRGNPEEGILAFCREHRVTLWIVGVPGRQRRKHHQAMMWVHSLRHKLGCSVEMVRPKSEIFRKESR
ncbi:universal stress protein [Desulfosoma caldarium]|uniref:Universal stress protein family protein n=1 Tax=Desulfosoma caldarium TaxID=610254 RepID=A0A3N1VPM5_9BACT|nr:universal stress protein [Desulfosoma caldarium]ROR02988.1 universal stress protein family protein [Desulfosoma caldarium]